MTMVGGRNWSPREREKENRGVEKLCVLMMNWKILHLIDTTVSDATTAEIIDFLTNFGRYTYGNNYYFYLLTRTVGGLIVCQPINARIEREVFTLVYRGPVDACLEMENNYHS